jgi:hypothetical protein
VKLHKNESGEIVIEATFVLSVCLMALFMMLNIGLYLYHSMLVQVAAEQTVSDMAMIYPYLKKEPEFGYTNYYDLAKFDTYRYFPLFNTIKKENNDKARWYAYGILQTKSIRKDDFLDAQVTVNISKSNLLTNQIQITVIDTYEMPLGGLLGIPKEVDIKASAAAVAVDVSDTMSVSNFGVFMIDYFSDTFLGKFLPAMEAWINLVDRIITL